MPPANSFSRQRIIFITHQNYDDLLTWMNVNMLFVLVISHIISISLFANIPIVVVAKAASVGCVSAYRLLESNKQISEIRIV